MRFLGARWLVSAAAAQAVVFTCGCAESDGQSPVDDCSTVLQPLFGGTDGSGVLSLSVGERAAIVSLESREGEYLCSGTMLPAGWVLTALHCTETDGVRVRQPLPWPALTPTVIVPHPELDAALLRVPARICSCGECPGALLPWDQPIDSSLDGALVTLAGSGLTERGIVGEVMFAEETVVDVQATEIWVDGHGATGACIGDSGGPMLLKDDSGRARQIGLLARGAGNCRGVDVYTRVDVLRPWMQEHGIAAAETDP